ncbi:MAG TPA: polysaccharide biosynthesis C-terminal domain-containing protein [Bacteroidota bacterium]|nr:polysaccharide biosynthesis C-terminal domain-containing protein [Bacteroidota bacterium]
MEESLTRKVARNTGFSAAGYFVSVAALFFLTPYVIGKLGAESYGIWVLVTILAGYWGLSDFGIGLSFQKFVAEYHTLRDVESINKVVNSGLAFYCLLGIAVLLIALPLIDPLLHLVQIPVLSLDEARIVSFIAVVNLAIANPLSVFSAALMGMQHIDLTRKIEMGVVVIRVLLYVFVLIQGWGIMGLILSETALVLLNAALNYSFLGRRFPELHLQPWKLDIPVFRKLFSYGSKLQVSRLAEMVAFQFDRIIVSNFIGLQFVVQADVGGKLLSRMRALPLNMLSTLLPAVSQLDALNQTQRIHLAFERSTKYLACFAVPMFLFVASFAHLIIWVWLGDSFVMAAYSLQILTLGYLLNVLTGTVSFVLQGMGDATTQMKVTLAQTIMNIVFSIGFVMAFGYYGVMIGTSLSLTISSIYFGIAFNKRIEGSFRRILAILVQPLIASGAGILLAMVPWAVGGFYPHERIADAGLLVMCGILFFPVYFVVLRMGKYFDAWDSEFLLRISPRLALVSRLIVSQRPAPSGHHITPP